MVMCGSSRPNASLAACSKSRVRGRFMRFVIFFRRACGSGVRAHRVRRESVEQLGPAKSKILFLLEGTNAESHARGWMRRNDVIAPQPLDTRSLLVGAMLRPPSSTRQFLLSPYGCQSCHFWPAFHPVESVSLYSVKTST